MASILKSSDVPERLFVYDGPITRGARWESYRPRAGDIVISAPPKSGMTWMQAICAMLVFGRADIALQPARISPWFDSSFEPIAAMLQRLELQTHRRYLKTHTPLDGLPYFPDVSYLAVFRHPLDAFYSAAALTIATARGGVRRRAAPPPDTRSYLLDCMRKPYSEGLGEQLSVASIAHDLMGFWTHRNLSNIHLFHYADMARNLPASIMAIGAAVGIDVNEDAAVEMAKTASFSNMQARSQQFAPESNGSWNNSRDFFAGGGIGKWKDVLGPDDVEEYRRICRRELPDEAALAWLEHGGRVTRPE